MVVLPCCRDLNKRPDLCKCCDRFEKRAERGGALRYYAQSTCCSCLSLRGDSSLRDNASKTNMLRQTYTVRLVVNWGRFVCWTFFVSLLKFLF